MHIRFYTPQDADHLAAIFHEAVHEIGALDYDREQVFAWSPTPVGGEKFHQRVSDGRGVFVALDANENAIGFIELEGDGQIDFFYVHPSHTRQGVGAALYARLEATAVQIGLTTLFVEASEGARRFFTKVGFSTEERHDFYRGGVSIHNYMMKKQLKS